jgi:hypothetical protein
MRSEESKERGRAAVRRRAARHLAAGKCQDCEKPRDPDSARYCAEHAHDNRVRSREYYRKHHPDHVGRGRKKWNLHLTASSG